MTTTKNIVLALALALAAAACAGKHAPPPAMPSLEQQVEEVKRRLLVLVEEQRHRLNVDAKPLALDSELSAAAQFHSDDMARKGSFDTMNPAGNPALNVLLDDPKFRGFVGENSGAQYFTPGRTLDADKLAQGFLDMWLSSPSHKYNLTFPRFDRTGIGISVGGELIFASEVFATDLGLPEP